MCQGFETLHINDKVKFEFVEKINTLENKPYFHRKLNLLGLSQSVPYTHQHHLANSSEAPRANESVPTETETLKEAKNARKQVKEVRFATETEKLILSYNFFDEISSSCA